MAGGWFPPLARLRGGAAPRCFACGEGAIGHAAWTAARELRLRVKPRRRRRRRLPRRLPRHWTYAGDEGDLARWGTLAPEFVKCSSGAEQTPIDLPGKAPRGASLAPLSFERAPLPGVLGQNGHTVQLTTRGAGCGVRSPSVASEEVSPRPASRPRASRAHGRQEGVRNRRDPLRARRRGRQPRSRRGSCSNAAKRTPRSRRTSITCRRRRRRSPRRSPARRWIRRASFRRRHLISPTRAR